MTPWFLFCGLLALSSLVFMGQFIMWANKKSEGRNCLPYAGVALWSGVYLYAFAHETPLLGLGLLAHAILLGMLHTFCYRLAVNHINIPLAHIIPSILTSVALFVIPFLPASPQMIISFYAFTGVVSTLILLLYCERINHILKENQQHGGPLLLSVGLLSISQFIVFSAMLVSPYLISDHPQWLSVVFTVLLPFLYRGTAALKQVPKRFCISRPLAFHTTLFTIAGLYLLGLSGIGLLAQQQGLTYTSSIVLMGAGTFPLLYLLSSQKLRREILVWISKHFFAAQFDYRNIWRRINQTLSPELQGADASTNALRAIQEAIHHPSGAYYQLHNRRWQRVAMEGDALSHEAEIELVDLLSHVLPTGWIVDIQEYHRSPSSYPTLSRSYPNLLSEKVHWVIPVTFADEHGAWVVSGGHRPKWTLDWETRDFLSILAQQVCGYLKAQHSRKELSEHAQLAAFHQTSAFVIHDMKNVYAQLSIMTKNAEKHKNNPEFIDDMLLSMSGMQKRIEKMLAQLTNKQHNAPHSNSEHFDVLAALLALSKDISFSQEKNAPLWHSPHNDQRIEVQASKDRFTNVIKHLIDNAQYATKGIEKPYVRVRCSADEKCVSITIEDNGVGMAPDFVKNRLFKPFETTKGNAGIGLGVYDAKQFADQAGGTLTIDSEVNQGTTITLMLPRSGFNETLNRRG